MCPEGVGLPVTISHHIGLKIIIFSIFLSLILSGACKNEEHEKFQTQKVTGQIKMPADKKSPALTKNPPASSENTPYKAETEASLKQSNHAKEPEKKEPGFYTTKKGDSLYKISGLPEVYDDPLKWPSLLRLNMAKLAEWPVYEDFEHKSLPERIKIKFVTPEEAERNLSQVPKEPWVVNVVSSQTSQKIAPAAIQLIRKGYRVYITKAIVKEEAWMRLRAGFYKDKKDALAAGQDIKALLDARDAWVAQIGKEERESAGSY